MSRIWPASIGRLLNLARSRRGFRAAGRCRHVAQTTDNGFILFELSDFDRVANASATSRSVTATLNDGGPVIDLETDNGRIRIDSR